MLKTVLTSLLLALAGAPLAHAQDCVSNFTSEGVPLVTAITYKSHQVFPKLDARKGLDNVARAVAAEGFSNIKIDKSLGAVTAIQETTGSGRPQTLRVVVRKTKQGARVDAVFMVQPGQVAPEGATRGGICRIVESADA